MEQEFEQLALFLEKKGYGKAQLLMHADPVYRLGFRTFVPTAKGYEVPLDLLHSSCGIEQEIISSAYMTEILPSVVLPVACLGHLIAMKLFSYNDWERIQDKADLVNLIAAADEEDLQMTEEAIKLMTERGYHAQKDLQAELKMFREKCGRN